VWRSVDHTGLICVYLVICSEFVVCVWQFLTISSLQQIIGSLTSWRSLYCVLRGGKLFCYYSPEEIEAKLEPALTISINKVKLVVWGFFLFWVFCLFWGRLFSFKDISTVIWGLSRRYAECFIRSMWVGYASVKYAVAEFFRKDITFLICGCKFLLLY